jgi:ureidoglycolate lyase
MKEIPYKKVSPEAFAVFGTCANLVSPTGPRLGEEPVQFFRDMVLSHLGTTQLASFSSLKVVKRPFVVDVSEYHDTCSEIVLPLDGDIVMHVAPAGPEKDFPLDKAQAFLVPRGTVCCLRPGVWHHAPFVLGAEVVHCLVVLPERTYMNDCKVCTLPTEKHLKIVGEGIR